MRNYKFTVQCKSGAMKTFEFQAKDFLAARAQLAELVDNN